MRRRLSHCVFGLLLLLSISTGTQAQLRGKPFVDSLIHALPGIAVDSVRLNALKTICASYENTNPDSAMFYGKQAIVLAQKAGNTKDVGMIDGGLGKMALIQGDYKTAKTFLDQDYEIAEKAGDKKTIENVLLCLGAIAQQTSNFPQCLDYTLKAARVAEEMKDTAGMEFCYMNTAVTFLAENNFAKTDEYAKLALETGKHSSNKALNMQVQAKAYETLGVSRFKQNDMVSAREDYEKAIPLYKALGMPMGVADMYTQLANTTNGDYPAMLRYALSAQAIYDSLAPKSFYSVLNLGNIGIAYEDIARNPRKPNVEIPGADVHAGNEELLKKAAAFLGRALSLTKELHTPENESAFSDSLSGVQAMLGQYKEAYQNLRRGNTVYDSLFSQENKNKMASLDEKYQLALRDAQIAAKNQALAAQARQRWFLIGGLVLLAVIGLLLYRQNLMRKRTNTTLLVLNNELDAANEVKLKFMSILNHDLRGPVANLINFLHLQKEAPEMMDESSSQAYSEKIKTHAENLLMTMEDLLAWSKGQMKNFTPHRKQLPVQEVFEDIRKHFDGTPGITIQFEAPPSFELYTDEHYLKTIMRNLTGNAIKALKGTPDATILWKAWEKDGRPYLSIVDNGPGATDQQLKALYDGSLPVGIKSGLGLHLVRDLAKAISCAVSVRSTPGKGTEFELRL